MRGLVVIIMLVGCGRWGFASGDEVTPDADAVPNDAAPDAALATPNICSARTVMTLPAAQSPSRIRVAPLGSGYVVAIQLSGERIHIARLDATGALVSMHMPFNGGYTLYGLSQIGDRPFVWLDLGGAGYIKMLQPGWDNYDTAIPSGDSVLIDPPQATLPGGITAMVGMISAGTMNLEVVDGAGMPTGVIGDYAPAALGGSLASTPSGARVLVESGAGVCETFTIAPDGTTGPRHSFGPCYQPVLATLGELGASVHLTSIGGPSSVHVIPAIATELGTDIPLGLATNARIGTIGGALWVGYRDIAGLGQLVRLDGGQQNWSPAPELDEPFDITPSGLIWLEGDTVAVGDPCLR